MGYNLLGYYCVSYGNVISYLFEYQMVFHCILYLTVYGASLIIIYWDVMAYQIVLEYINLLLYYILYIAYYIKLLYFI